jgi:hypothetical protein
MMEGYPHLSADWKPMMEGVPRLLINWQAPEGLMLVGGIEYGRQDWEPMMEGDPTSVSWLEAHNGGGPMPALQRRDPEGLVLLDFWCQGT